MAKVLKVPVLGQTVEEVRILQWFKQEGDTVAVGEPLAELETDKTSMEWESPESGTVRKLLAPADSYVPVEAPLVIVGQPDEAIDDLLAEAGGAANGTNTEKPPQPVAVSPPVSAGAAPAAVSDSALTASVVASPRARRVADEVGVDVRQLAGHGSGPGGRIIERDVLALREQLEAAAAAAAAAVTATGRGPKASPLARAVASDTGVDLGDLAGSGSGPGGRITASDVRAQSTPLPAELAPPPATTRTVQITGMRKRVADNILRSVQRAPHVTLHLRADMTEATRLRGQLLPAIEKSHQVRVSPTDIIVKAAARALVEFPSMNAHIDGDTLTLFDRVHVGLAVSLGDNGLIVPVIRDVHQKGLAQIAQNRADLAARARDNQLTGDEISGATFTVSNLGGYGIELFNPIIAPPQVAILGVGQIADQVVAVGGLPAVRPMIGLSLSFDHRAMDGAPAAAFLARLKETLENPYLLIA